MSEFTEKETTGLSSPSIGTAAARKREQLQRMKEAEQKRQQTAREERLLLAKELAELEAREGRQRRATEGLERKRVCSVLGEVMLNAIQHQGMANFKIETASLANLKVDDLDTIKRVVSRSKKVSSPGEADVQTQVSDSVGKLDIEI